ncbi:MAG: ImmA/IrrE family metallo-endopeptidase, partial [Leptospiraceae bacterium]|nr:ImmA/IrrE family metallo-endopeptidase [Leptospiraceae bacterium]
PPGDTILDILNEKGWSQAEFAERMGYSKKHINLLIQGKAPITEETAGKLERVLGSTAGFWLTREAHYREALLKKGELSLFNSLEYQNWVKSLPISDMIRLGGIQKRKTLSEQVLECLKYFGVADLNAFHRRYSNPILAFRSSEKFLKASHSVAAYLRYGEIKAENISPNEWNEQLLRSSLSKILSISLEKDFKKTVLELKNILLKCGIVLVVAPTPKGCPIFGLTRWLKPQHALIMLSLRYKTNDHFWFTLLHEIGHLLLHRKKFLYLEFDDTNLSREEHEANEFASETLIPKKFELELKSLDLSSEKAIIEFAHKLKIHPAIVVGRLQHERILGWKTHLNSLKLKINWDVILNEEGLF